MNSMITIMLMDEKSCNFSSMEQKDSYSTSYPNDVPKQKKGRKVMFDYQQVQKRFKRVEWTFDMF